MSRNRGGKPGLKGRGLTAQRREDIRNSRSPEQQLKVLDERLGYGKGAVSERARLTALIATARQKGSAREVSKEMHTNAKEVRHEEGVSMHLAQELATMGRQGEKD